MIGNVFSQIMNSVSMLKSIVVRFTAHGTNPTPMYSETDATNRFCQIRYALELVKLTDEVAKHASKRT